MTNAGHTTPLLCRKSDELASKLMSSLSKLALKWEYLELTVALLNLMTGPTC